MKKRQCPVTMGTGMEVNGETDFRCELPDDGHEWHQHLTPPVRAIWKKTERGIMIKEMISLSGTKERGTHERH